MRHRLRNRIIIRCLSSGETGCALMPDDADVSECGLTPETGCDPMCAQMCARLTFLMMLMQLMLLMPPSPHKPHKPK